MISLRSKVARKVLDYYFINPDAEHYINEIARILGLDPKNTETKLKEFEKQGLLKSEFRGKQRYFFLAKENPLLKHYREIFLKTFGLQKRLKEALMGIEGIQEAYIFGSFASDTMDISSDIDILAVGTHLGLDLQRKIVALEKDTGREINIKNLSPKEFAEKKKNKNPFIAHVFKGKTIKLI